MLVRSNHLPPPAGAEHGLTARTRPALTPSCLRLPGGQPALGPGSAGPASPAHGQELRKAAAAAGGHLNCSTSLKQGDGKGK